MDFYIEIAKMVISLLSAMLIVVGWYFTYKMSKQQEDLRFEKNKELERIRWKKEMIDKQISDFYGPLFALITESDILFSRILYQIGRNHIIPSGKEFKDLPENEQKIWMHYVDNYKIPTQMEMVKIIRNNMHLVYNSEFGDSFYMEFLDYSLGWELLDNQQKNRVPNFYQYHYVYNYPKSFNNYIKYTYKRLLIEQQDLISESEKIAKELSK